MPQPDPFWKELIERKNQEILDKFVESIDEPIQTHVSPSPPPAKKDKMVEFKKEWKEITDKWGSPIKEIPVQNKSTTYYKPTEPFKFTVFDLNDQELGKVKTKQEAINLFMERYPQFDKKAIEPFIIEK